ncbi:early activation antigen CD69 isoform X1 [Electrophorus electricus]|uniref:C-type lectin domain-containing protein n=1 Tax=Electrophorus electricus TaxID=8005 RepID=A0A4W4FLW5_ELEEL|nr:early activation antigen CD69 isoform X1 [Electrophorus electricus]XP_035386872.1 early activation antigen CD69 isoform X1 [Electrophorus electricus]
MEKGSEVEMEQISPAEKKEDEDVKKDTGQETKDEKELKGENKNIYSVLFNPTEDIYTSSKMPGSPPKFHKDVNGRVNFYRGLSVILLLLCVLFLAVILALSIKLSEVQGNQECPDVEKTTVAEACNCQKCEFMYKTRASDHNKHLCSECGTGWHKFENSCYFLSEKRLNWLESREKCQEKGGDLAVISNERVQTFLTEKGPMLYWIGLHDLGTQQWTWINNTALTQSYWFQTPNAGHCALLRGWKSPQNNWYSNRCEIYSHFICERVKAFYK